MPTGVNNLLASRREKPDTLCLRVRTKMKISQAEMAAELGVHPESIRRYESGVHHPNRWIQPVLEQLAKRHRVKI